MAQILKNNVSGVLSTQLNSANTSMVLVDASNFPAPTGGDFYLLTLVGLNTNGQEATWEVVKVTAKASNTMTVVRAQEGTTAATWPVGATVQLRLTADSVVTPTALDASIAAHVAALDPHPTYTTVSEAAAAAPVQSVAGRTGAVTLAKADVGLGSVDNTTDLLKPISTATQAALNGNVAITTHAATAKAAPADADELGITDSAASWGLKKLTFANLKAWIGSLFVSKSGDTINGDLNFSGVGRRITGDLSNTTVANRLLFQTAALNNQTRIAVIPNGGEFDTAVDLFSNDTDPNNSTRFSLRLGADAATLVSTKEGSGAYRPMAFVAGGAERMRIDTGGNVGIGTSAPAGKLAVSSGDNNKQFVIDVSADPVVKIGLPYWYNVGTLSFVNAGAERLRIDASGKVLVTGGALGYGSGSGGVVTQETSKSTEVTLNKPSGIINVNNAELNAGATAYFTFTNASFVSSDVLVLTIIGQFADKYTVRFTHIAEGVGSIAITNNTAGSLSEPIGINFVVLKAVRS